MTYVLIFSHIKEASIRTLRSSLSSKKLVVTESAPSETQCTEPQLFTYINYSVLFLCKTHKNRIFVHDEFQI
jgi:hypothetical protein